VKSISSNEWSDVLSRMNDLWDRAEVLAIRFFRSCGILPQENSIPDSPSDAQQDDLPRMTDFNVIVSAIKRIQEGRLDLLKEVERRATVAGDENANPLASPEYISRMLETLKEPGMDADDAEDPLQD